MKRILLLAALPLVCAAAAAQTATKADKAAGEGLFNHLDADITLGTTGIGADIQAPIGPLVRVRAGLTYMPHFHHNMTFGIRVGDNPQETEAEQASKFAKLSDMMAEFTGTRVDNSVEMVGQPTMDNFRLMVDVMPFTNRHWHLTAGFYLGSARVAKAWNATEDAPSLFAVAMYNSLYERIIRSYNNDEPFVSFLGNDLYAGDDLYQKVLEYGRMGVHIGNYTSDVRAADGSVLHRRGESYMMEPDENDMAKARLRVNRFRPYLGFGYEGRLFKTDDRYRVALECGVMFWGGKPRIITHDGTDLSRDVENIGGSVGDYVKLINNFVAYPVVNVRFSRRIF